MSRGRPHHQSSRRRSYSSRQRDLRERQMPDADDAARVASGRLVAFEIEEPAEFESASPWPLQLAGRASAA